MTPNIKKKKKKKKKISAHLPLILKELAVGLALEAQKGQHFLTMVRTIIGNVRNI